MESNVINVVNGKTKNMLLGEAIALMYRERVRVQYEDWEQEKWLYINDDGIIHLRLSDYEDNILVDYASLPSDAKWNMIEFTE